MKFKVGDIVVCELKGGISFIVENGKVYTVLDTADTEHTQVSVIKGIWYDEELFRLATKLERSLL